MSTHMVYAQRGATQVTCADGRRMTFEPLGGSFGATVHGVDLSREVSDAEIAELRRAFNIYGALRFPDQQLEPADEIRAMRLFDDIADPAHGSNYNHVPGYPSLIILSNIIGDDNQPLGSASKGGMEWHTDGSGWRRPPTASCLYAVEVPSTGGETYFANGYLAYESLPKAERDRLSAMKARYSWPTLRKWLDEAVGRPPQEFTDDERAEHPDVDRPLVRTHPVTGRKALWFSIEEITDIDNMGYDASRQLLLGLIEHMTTTPHVLFRHDWTPGDFVVWDNRCLMHSVCDYNYEGQRRLMHQITGKGPEL